MKPEKKAQVVRGSSPPQGMQDDVDRWARIRLGS
jgi:hypothetical protein